MIIHMEADPKFLDHRQTAPKIFLTEVFPLHKSSMLSYISCKTTAVPEIAISETKGHLSTPKVADFFPSIILNVDEHQLQQ